MPRTTKIAIIGDYSFAYNTHHATNMAMEHASIFFEEDINFYWLRPSEVINFRRNELQDYHGIWLAPGPYHNAFHVESIFTSIFDSERPTLITGEGFIHLLNYYIHKYRLNPANEKFVSENLIAGNQFDTVNIAPTSDWSKKIYENHTTVELTAARYAIYPRLIEMLTAEFVDVLATDQFDEVQIMRLKNKSEALVCMFLPQISSTRDRPHPLINSFIRRCMEPVTT
jgi:CTP synthase (UTP-ammonia lyase)